jgi:hypothetical protein
LPYSPSSFTDTRPAVKPMNEEEFFKCLREIFPGVPLKPDGIGALLEGIGLVNPGGSFHSEREKKAYEIAHFSSHVVKAVGKISRKRDVTMLDCGCGRSYLSFFVNYILKKLYREVDFIGVDSDAKLVETCLEIRKKLGFDNMQFFQSEIINFEPEEKVNIACALHACDTATDAAIALGVKLEARYIMAAPCCQRQVVRQVGRISKEMPAMQPLVSTKVSKEYVGVALTETLRKLALESFGYKVDMFEFISTKYTPKNILLRAEKKRAWNRDSLEMYRGLRDCFNVRPKIQEYLRDLA